jgi:hypothetical protein
LKVAIEIVDLPKKHGGVPVRQGSDQHVFLRYLRLAMVLAASILKDPMAVLSVSMCRAAMGFDGPKRQEQFDQFMVAKTLLAITEIITGMVMVFIPD